jgi:hypothetical protein
MLDPKTLWRIKTDVNVVPVPPPVPRINSKGTAVLNARCVGNRGKSKRRLKTTGRRKRPDALSVSSSPTGLTFRRSSARSAPRIGPRRPDVNVVPVPPPVRKINSKGTAVLNARRAGQRRQIQEKTQDYSGFGLKAQTPTSKSAQLTSRAPARAAGHGPSGLRQRCQLVGRNQG